MLAWRKLVFWLVNWVKQSKRNDCEGMCVSAMMLIEKWWGVWLSGDILVLRVRVCKDGLC